MTKPSAGATLGAARDSARPPAESRDHYAWSGRWAADRLGIQLRTTSAPASLVLTDVVGLAVRRNPRRAHLLVSGLLGKHVPTDPRLVDAAGLVLGDLVRRTLCHCSADRAFACAEADSPAPVRRASLLAAAGAAQRHGPAGTDRVAELAATIGALPRRPDVGCTALVMGFAETATALGHCVADAVGPTRYLHSTRRHVAGVQPLGGFEEEHSHATTHLLLAADPAWLDSAAPLVLVDDELSTGLTAMNTLRVLHRLAPRDRYVLAALVDVRSATDRRRMTELAITLGARVDVVALVSGEVDLPVDVMERGARVLAAAASAPVERPAVPAPVDAHDLSAPRRFRPAWPDTLPEAARHGVDPQDAERLDVHLPAVVAQLRAALTAGGRPEPARLLVLGTEELMYVPLRIASGLASVASPACRVLFSTTTRSPALALDDPGYAIRSVLSFPAHDDPTDGPGARFVYNLGPADSAPEFDAVLLMVDERGDTPALDREGGLATVLRGVANDVVVVTIPGTAERRARAQRTASTDDPLLPAVTEDRR